MRKFSCFSLLNGRKKEKKGTEGVARSIKRSPKTLLVRLEPPVKPLEADDELKPTSFNVSIPLDLKKDSNFNVKITAHESPVSRVEPTEVAYEGEDEHEETDKDNRSIKRDLSDFNLQAREREAVSGPVEFDSMNTEYQQDAVDLTMQSGHVSDPGTRKPEFMATPMLKRSCSNLEIGEVLKRASNKLSPPSKSQSFEELQELNHSTKESVDHIDGCSSPISVNSHFSADKVMLRKHSSSQVLPSRSRRLWWKLFLWSHRNSLAKTVENRPVPARVRTLAVMNRRVGGYSSDTLEPSRAFKSKTMESALSSGLWSQNQWVAFAGESSSSPYSRVDEWVNDLSIEPEIPDINEEYNRVDNGERGDIVFPPSPGTARGSVHHLARYHESNLGEEILHANSLIQSLNSSSMVAHISGVGLKVVPTLSRFSSLKSVNLSGNSIVRITPGSLPRGLHALNLSKNKISAIEGLRELTRLRILDLSHNRISRIGHGLSNCSLIKELYLAGNKISEIEGLHRLLKLTVLDLGFNKITTTKSLGQLVANYNSLLALNLLGNPIHSNISDEQLRKSVSGLLPKLVYLNKQPLKQQRAREVVMDGVAKAALGVGGGRASAARRKVSGKRAAGQVKARPSSSGPVPSRRSEKLKRRGKKI